MKRILNSVIILIFPFFVCSQENDFQIWSSFSSTVDCNIIAIPRDTKKKNKRKLSLTIKQGYRFRENASLLSKQFTDFRAKVKINKRFSTAIGYRYSSDWNQPLENMQYLFYPYVENKNRCLTDYPITNII